MWNEWCRTPRSRTGSPDPSSRASATSRRSTSSRARSTGPRATRSSPPTSSPPKTAPASSTRRSRSARTTSASASSSGLKPINPVKPDGTYDHRIGPYENRWVKDADPDLINDLEAKGKLLRAETYEHSYPHCWRCGTPLLYYAKPSWYIATSQIKDRLLASNETVNWYPGHVKHGRFGNWLEGNVDWALSRERYWGTPLPIWRCKNEHFEAIGSLAELNERARTNITDPHRPYVDEATFPCPTCEEPMTRTPEVIDVWFDSGSMPFAQYHAPLENQQHFEERFPADFVCEAVDQTRGWFYSLIAVSTLLFDRASTATSSASA